ncbi:hypothetical protein BDV37DRAFT_213974 [Aspergillus pseudonomiae]|uniref:Uncharacterized protein n=1 Tax=Aspergillus pseudonomiae TaxID=1506151 RepID=A0A5N7D0S7_9EURO|nr:uncharacterized protein BDV37DRAFT_213974 [Aspergillus pseudonomiae]KAE8400020.1 hypothetical protein BDV37DRAFT_213974 [Aspergillus pseudonomiae]
MRNQPEDFFQTLIKTERIFARASSSWGRSLVPTCLATGVSFLESRFPELGHGTLLHDKPRSVSLVITAQPSPWIHQLDLSTIVCVYGVLILLRSAIDEAYLIYRVGRTELCSRDEA